MTDDLRFERLARDWLELGPVDAPDQAVQAALLEIDTTNQERDLRVPWRFPTMNRIALVAAGAAIAALLGLGALVAGSRPTSTPAPTSNPAVIGPASPTVAPTPTPTVRTTPDTSRLGGRILVEHFGNAPDGSETDTGGDVHRLYLADPNNMTGTGMTEFLPGKPAGGKLSADVSPDSSRVVFEDWGGQPSIYLVGIDGTGYRKLTPQRCACAEWDPAFDPTGTRIVYGHAAGGRAWLQVRDLTTNKTTDIPMTEGPADDAVPEAPTWSADGTKIAFVRLTWNGIPANFGRVHAHVGIPSADVLSVVDLVGDAPTTLPTPGLYPGDPDWSPDGSSILFTNAPVTMFDDSSLTHPLYTIKPDGSGLTMVATHVGSRVTPFEGDSATWTSDGRILSTYNEFTLIRPDGTGLRFVDDNGMDNTENAVGFVYVGHWVGTP